MTEYLEQYRDQGFAIVRQVFTPSEVAELKAAFDAVYAEGLRHPSSYRHQNVFFNLADDARLGNIIRMVQWPSYFNETLNQTRLDKRMLAVVAPLIGRDLKQIINQMHWKPPGAATVSFGFHQDICFRKPREAYREPATSYVQTGIAVDDHTCENGAMLVYPGSHRLGELSFTAEGRVMENTPKRDDLSAVGLDPAKLVALEMAAGDVALWSPYTVHGSGANKTASDRRLYINGYVAAQQCDRGVMTFQGGEPCALGAPVLIHYDDVFARPEPHYPDL